MLREIFLTGIKRLLDDLEVTAAKVCITAAKLLLLVYVSTARVKLVLLVKIEENILSSYHCFCSKIKTTERVFTVREWIKTEERIKIDWRSRIDLRGILAHMVAASKVPMLKPGEYELWRMRMEQYIQMIDYSLWEVIENGNAPPITKVVEGVETTIVPTTVEVKGHKGELLERSLCEWYLRTIGFDKSKGCVTTAINRGTLYIGSAGLPRNKENKNRETQEGLRSSGGQLLLMLWCLAMVLDIVRSDQAEEWFRVCEAYFCLIMKIESVYESRYHGLKREIDLRK
ncbi:hypothetical protein Tco_0128545 [Tanacetum coccineum]